MIETREIEYKRTFRVQVIKADIQLLSVHSVYPYVNDTRVLILNGMLWCEAE